MYAHVLSKLLNSGFAFDRVLRFFAPAMANVDGEVKTEDLVPREGMSNLELPAPQDPDDQGTNVNIVTNDLYPLCFYNATNQANARLQEKMIGCAAVEGVQMCNFITQSTSSRVEATINSCCKAQLNWAECARQGEALFAGFATGRARPAYELRRWRASATTGSGATGDRHNINTRRSVGHDLHADRRPRHDIGCGDSGNCARGGCHKRSRHRGGRCGTGRGVLPKSGESRAAVL